MSEKKLWKEILLIIIKTDFKQKGLRKMSGLELIAGKKEEISEQYLPQLFALRQQHEEEIFPFIPPSLELYKESWKVPSSSSVSGLWILGINEEDCVIGYGNIVWNIKYDNLDKAHFTIYIARPYRRKGYGSSILKKIVEIVPPQIKILRASSFENSDGLQFLRNLKGKNKYIEMINIANLAEFDAKEAVEEANKQKEEAQSKGYEIIFIDKAKYSNQLDYPEFTKVVESIWNDMPRENLSEEDAKVTPERHQEIYDLNQQKGDHYFAFVAIHKQTKQTVGFTTASVNKYQPWVAWQDDTGIIHEHRGNGLGLALKYQMLKKLIEETEVKYWFTGNNHKNEHMIRINRILKHKKWTQEFVFEFEKEAMSIFLENNL